MKLLPFDLEEALKGAPVVTRSGTKIVEIFYSKEVKGVHKLIVVNEKGYLWQYQVDGRINTDSDWDSMLDLFMLGEDEREKPIIDRDIELYQAGKEHFEMKLRRCDPSKEKLYQNIILLHDDIICTMWGLKSMMQLLKGKENE